MKKTSTHEKPLNKNHFLNNDVKIKESILNYQIKLIFLFNYFSIALLTNKIIMQTETEIFNLGSQIKNKLSELSNSDGLKRTQRWLSIQTGIAEAELSNKINKVNNSYFSQLDLDKINQVLGTKFKLIS